jgi:opacity protein-like surface antigen
MRRSAAAASVLLLSSVLVALSSSASAAPVWEPVAGELGRDRARVMVRVGGNYGLMRGSELENMDPSKGFEAGIAVPVLGSLSVTGSWATDRANVDGQVVRLLDQAVRPDGRSGTVKGEVETTRFRAGIRLDAYRETDWKFTPYFQGAVVFSEIRVTLDSVDGRDPQPIPLPDGSGQVLDIREYSDNEIGALGRAGVEYHVTSRFAVDLSGSVEIIEFQAGTNSIYSLGTGISARF